MMGDAVCRQGRGYAIGIISVVVVSAVMLLAQAQPGNNSVNMPATNPVSPATPDKTTQSFTGTLSDSFCLRKHYMLVGANPAECTRYCIAHDGHYVLMSGDKIYELENQPGAVLMKYAGQQVHVTGNLLNGTTIEIKSVAAAGEAAGK